MREKVFLLTSLCPEAVVNLNVPNEEWYIRCHNTLQGLGNVENWLLLEMTEKGARRGVWREASWSGGWPTQLIFAAV